jgi:hypothetical protein
MPEIDLIINQDTLLELSPARVRQIVKPLVRRMRGPLVSIGPDYSGSGKNWQRGGGLREELSSYGLTLVDRVPFHVREGYMREIYSRQY